MGTQKFLWTAPFAIFLFAGCSKPAPLPAHITVEMKKYVITPAEIHLKLGEAVRFEVSAKDVEHGFDVPALGIKEAVQPGKPASFMVTPTRKGSFTIECGIICGPGHDDMRGKIVVD